MLCFNNAMASTISTIAFGNARSSFRANNINGSIHAEFHLQPGYDNLLSRLPHAKDAPFNSYAKQHESTCLCHTRPHLLDEIYSWADGPDERCIFWLSGLAGTGKSTIARTVARRYYEKQRLAASFFFSRGGGDVGHAARFVTSIAVQLVRSVPASRQLICDAVAERSDIAQQSLRDQWQHLVCRPLSKLNEPEPYVIVIDALDECDNDSNIRIIVQLLAEARSLAGVRLRVFLTSRREVPIRHGFGKTTSTEHKNVVLHDISPLIVDHDIGLFFEDRLQSIGREACLGTGWPGAEIIMQLVQSASGLFIWAATACRFIRNGKRFAAQRLETILCADNNTIAAPEKHLNQIYVTVLQNSLSSYHTHEEREEHCGMLRYILGSVVVLFSFLSARCLSTLLHIADENVSQTLGDLHAILSIPEDSTQPLRLHHPSFRDFLLSKERCDDERFWVDEYSIHGKLASRCLELMSTPNGLRQDMCHLGSIGTLRSEVKDEMVANSLPLELQYACRYWVEHLERSQCGIADGDAAHAFLQTHLLHWLEAMSLMGETDQCVRLLARLQAMAAPSEAACAGFLRDANRFVLRFGSILAEAPLQVYLSALVFAPETSVIRQRFFDQNPQAMKLLVGRDTDWDACRSVLQGHSGWVTAVVFSPDGQLLASASGDKTVRVWETVTGTCRSELRGHSGAVAAVVISPDGQLLASASGDKTVRVWEMATGTCRSELRGHSDAVTAVMFSPDGQLLASASGDKTVRVWETATGTCRGELNGHSGPVTAVMFSPDGQLLASASCDKTVRVWETATGTCRSELNGHSHPVTAVVFSPDGQLLASASSDETVRVWETATGTCSSKLKGHLDAVTAVIFSSDGQLLASASGDKTVRVWETATGTCRGELNGHSGPVTAVMFSQDGQLVASASEDKTVRVWETATGTCRGKLNGHSGAVMAVAFSPDGQLVASASNDETVRVWETATDTCRNELRCHSHPVTAVVFSPNGQLLASTSNDKTVRVWETATGACCSELKGHPGAVTAVVFSPDGQLLASVSWDDTVRVWGTATGTCRSELRGHSGAVTTVVFSPDGQLLASASGDNTVRVWETVTGTCRSELRGHSGWVTTVVFSPDGQLLASASGDKTVRVWETATGMCRGELNGHSRCVTAVVFSPDGQLLASASCDKTVRVWETATGTCRSELKGHSRAVTTVVFSPDGQLLASASSEKKVRVWEMATGTCRRVLKHQYSYIYHLTFSLDGQTLHTNEGDIILSSSLSLPSPVQNEEQPSHLLVEGQWVLRNMQRFLWLPFEYRADHIVVYKDTVCLGCPSGRVALLRLQ